MLMSVRRVGRFSIGPIVLCGLMMLFTESSISVFFYSTKSLTSLITHTICTDLATMTHTQPETKDIYLFGFPIAHSGAPSLHNLVFESFGSPRTYKLWSTSAVNQAVLDELRSASSGGAA